MPARKEEFLQFAAENPEMLWVRKNNEHRGIVVQKQNEIRFDDGNHFIQEYISNPLLIDGRFGKFLLLFVLCFFFEFIFFFVGF